MSKSEKPDGYALKKVGKVWLLGKPGKQDFKVCPFLTHAKEVNTSENFIIADENVYEIKEVEHEELLLVKVEEIKVCDQQKIKTQSNKSLFRYDRETNYDRGESLIQYNAEETHFDTENDVIKVTDESELVQMHDTFSSLEVAGQTEDTSLIDNKVTDELEQMHDEYSSLKEAGQTEDTSLIDNKVTDELEQMHDEYSSLKEAGQTEDTSLIDNKVTDELEQMHNEYSSLKEADQTEDTNLIDNEGKQDEIEFTETDLVNKAQSKDPLPKEAFEAKQREGVFVEITRRADSEGFGAIGLKTTEDFEASCLKTTVSKSSRTLPEPLAYEEGWKQNVFCFLVSEKLKLHLVQDIFSVKANGIVVSVNEKGKFGAVGQALQNKIPKSYLSSFNGDFERKINQGTKTGDVIVNCGYSCDYPAVLLVIYPYEARHKPQDERQADLERAYKNVLLAAGDKQIHTVVTTLFGIESNNDDEVKLAANCFLKSYLEYCKQKLIENKTFQTEVTIVCQTEHAYSLVCEVFMKYVYDHKDKDMKKTSFSENLQDDTKASAGELDDCVICLDGIKEPKRLDCGDTFCKECIEQHFKFVQKCPTCGYVCGKITGNQPDGTMDVYVNKYQHLTGYNSCGTIIITYNFQSSSQTKDHPNPGKWYKGIVRRAYLPDNKEGRKIAKMLKVAFERKLVFTIGSSTTTGQEGVITWNDIHHKTDFRPHKQFGYPDPTYLEQVKDELASKGVTEHDISGVKL